MWLKKLQIAIAQKDVELLSTLLDDIPELSDAQELQSAVILLDQAKEILLELQDETTQAMQQLKKNSDFLKVSQNKTPNRLDIRS